MQFSAVAECCVNELYASLDGIRDVIYSVYSESVQGVQRKSTSKLFSKAKNKNYSASFPQELNALLSNAYDSWFLLLRKYRTEFTHGSLGSCHKDKKTDKISYMHVGLGKDNRALIIEDITNYINDVANEVLLLQHNIFEFLYSSLPLESTQTMCGIYTGLMYLREIEPEQPLTRNSGKCLYFPR